MNILSVFQSLMDETVVPEQFVEWAGMSLVSALLQRRVFIMYQGRELYPNTYTMLVGPAGTGKSWAITELCNRVARQIEGMSVAPDSLTKEQLYELMEKAQRPFHNNKGEMLVQSPFCIFADEFQLFLDGTDVKFVQALCKLYDCGPEFSHEIKTGKSSHAFDPCLAILGGATYDGLTTIFTTNSTERGILRRFFFISATGKKHLKKPPRLGEFGHELKADERLRATAVSLANKIYNLQGEFSIQAEAYDIFVKKELEFRVQVPSKVTAWFNARDALLLKLAMIRAVANNMELIIKAHDMMEAITLLDAAAGCIEDAMRCVITTPQTQATLKFVENVTNLLRRKGVECLPVQTVNQMLMHYVRPTDVRSTLTQMIDSGFCTREGAGGFEFIRFNLNPTAEETKH